MRESDFSQVNAAWD